MKKSLVGTLTKLMREKADDLDNGSSVLSVAEMTDLTDSLCHIGMSKAQACRYLNLSRSQFGKLIAAGKMPEGRKEVGHNELEWYKDELNACLRKITEE